MVYEYALEPSLLNNWKDFRYFTEKFGVSQGRLISRYPKRWKKLVYESLIDCDDIDRKRIEEGLQRIDDCMLKRQADWDTQQEWLNNAEAEHSRRAFHAILARTNPNQCDFVLEGEGLDDTHPRWNVPRSRAVPRVAQEMADCVAPLLRVCQEILFIDPHFRPKEDRYQRPLKAFLDAILEQRQGEPPMRIEIHASDKKLEADFFKSECYRHLPKIIPAGISVRLVQWHQKEGSEKLHNRFVLTDRGGVMFGVGLDDDDGANGETDDVTLLDEDVYKFRWKQYTSDPAFDFIDEIVVEGKRTRRDQKIQ